MCVRLKRQETKPGNNQERTAPLPPNMFYPLMAALHLMYIPPPSLS